MEEAWAVPNPNPNALHVKVAGRCDSVRVLLYTKGMTLLGVDEGPGSSGPGWVRVSLSTPLANGTYYYRVRALRGGAASAPSPAGKLVQLR